MGLIKSLLMPMIGSLFSGALGGLTGGALGGSGAMPQFNPIGMTRQLNPLNSIMGGGGGGGRPNAAAMPQMGGQNASVMNQPQFQPIPNGLNAQKEAQRQQQVQQEQPQQVQQPQQSFTPLLNAIFPTSSHTITSGFGNRTAPTAGASSFHQGIDIGGKQGSPLMAALSGVIQQVGRNAGMGNYMKMLADNGMTLTYGHANNFGVQPGQRVEAGQNVGTMGSTGISTGPHLHFMASQGGKYFDPRDLFKQYLAGR